MENRWKQWFSVRRIFEEECKRQDIWWWRRRTSTAMSARRRSTTTIASSFICLTLITKEKGPVRSLRCWSEALARYFCGTSTFCSERVDHETVLMVTFMGKCVTIEQDPLFEEQKGIDRMKQISLSFATSVLGSRCVQSLEKLKWNCVEAGGLPVRAPPLKTTASCCQRPPRSAPLGTGLPLEAPSVKKMPPVKVPRATQKAFPCGKMEV